MKKLEIEEIAKMGCFLKKNFKDGSNIQKVVAEFLPRQLYKRLYTS